MYPTPQLQEVYQDEFISIQLDNDLSLVHVEWFKHPQSQEFRKVFQQLAEIIIESKSKYWLSDARAIHFLELGDQNWILKEMAPLLEKTKLLKFARVITKEGLEMMDIVPLYNKLEQSQKMKMQTQFELFIDKDDALEWLLADA